MSEITGFGWYWDRMTAEQKRRVAEKVGTSYMVLGHVAKGRREFAPLRAIEVRKALREIGFERAMLKHLRPDIWERE